MADQPSNPPELDFQPPLKGVWQTSAPHLVPDGFSPDAENVFAYAAGNAGRATVGQRMGVSKYFPTSGTNAVNFGDGTNGAFIQYMGQVTVQDTTGAETLNRLVIVSGGKVYLQSTTDTTANRIDGSGTAAATFSPGRRVSHCVFQNVSYFSDGLVVKQYDHAGESFDDWTASDGTFPAAGGRYPRYLCVWRGRLVLAYLEKGNPGLWFMSAMDGPTDFNYNGTNQATMAVASNSNFRAGQMGQVVTALIPVSEDVLLFGLDHSLYELRGDPGAGGSLMPISETIGVLNDDAWCMAGDVLYFMSNVGLVRYVGGRLDVVSDPSAKELWKDVRQVGEYVELEYDAKRSCVWIFVTKETSPFTTRHAIYDLRAERLYGDGAGFWPVRFPADTGGDDLAGGTTAPTFGPSKACVFDGYEGTNTARVVLLGGRDGYVRVVDDDALDDDGQAIVSRCWFKPMQPAGASSEFLINGHRPVMANLSDTTVDWTLQGGPDPYSASNSATLSRTGTFTTGGRQGVLGDRMSANTVYLKLENDALGKTWAVERWTASVAPSGPVR